MFFDMKISTRLATVLGILSIVLVAIGAAGIWGIRATNARLQTVYEDRTIALEQIARINTLMLQNMRQVQLALAHDPRLEESRLHEHAVTVHLDKVEATIETIGGIWKGYMATYLTPDEKQLAERFIGLRTAYVKDGLRPALALIKDGKFSAAGTHVTSRLNPLYDAAQKENEALIQLQVDVARDEFSAGQRDYQRFVTVAVICMLLGVGVAAYLGWMLNRAISVPMRTAVDAADRVAAGDLTTELDTRRSDEIGAMMNALARMVARLRDTLGQVQAASSAVSKESSELHGEIAGLSQRTEQQAANLEETAATMEELTSTVRQNADNARQANQLAITASDVASKGGAVVSEVVTTMGTIATSSKRIADIITVIDGIAFQTNILALNAAVEAARAGEQGRGFAVVASEVRSLAQRSANAAKEIKDLITASVRNVESGSALVANAGATMAEVVQAVKRVTDIMAEISSASQEQASGLDQVSQAVAQLDQITQQNAGLVQAASASAEELDGTSRELAASMAGFRVGAAQVRAAEAAAAVMHRATTAAANQKTGRHAPAIAGAPRATRRDTGLRPTASLEAKRIGSARAANKDDEWTEF